MTMAARPKSVASLMKLSIDRRSSLEKARFQLAPRQIQTVLLGFLQNNDVKQYNDILMKLRTYDINNENFKILIEDCSNCVCFFDRNTNEFISALTQVQWIRRPTELTDLYQQFILNLVTAQTYHIPTVMSSILSIFKKDIQMWEDQPIAEQSNSWSICHALISRVLNAVPLSKEILLRCILEQYPYHKNSCSSNRAYVYNLLLMTKYIPDKTEQLIAIIVNRMAVLDVSTEQLNKNDTSIFSMEMENSGDSMMDTVDFCMVELLQWMETEQNTAINIILNVFEKILLPTYGTRFIQYLLFYAISINQPCADRALSMLWSVASGHHAHGSSASSLRCAATVHLSGLIARANRLPTSRLFHYLKLATDWCHNYITATQDCMTSKHDQYKTHAAFYAICEAIFYLTAFKHQKLFCDRKALTFVESLNLPRLVTCALNPLRFCSTHVARAFAAVTRSYQIVYCHTLLERNTRHNFISSSDSHHYQWFPYDPYKLSRSGKWIWPFYAEYEELSDTRDADISDCRHKLKDVDDDDFLASSPGLSSSFSKHVLPGFKQQDI